MKKIVYTEEEANNSIHNTTNFNLKKGTTRSDTQFVLEERMNHAVLVCTFSLSIFHQGASLHLLRIAAISYINCATDILKLLTKLSYKDEEDLAVRRGGRMSE